MKRFIAFVLIAIISGSALISAHPASKIDILFDKETRTLKVTVNHVTKDATKHYIHKITIEVNGEKRIEQTFISQLTDQNQDAKFFIADLKTGDKIELIAHCNVFGKQKSAISIP